MVQYLILVFLILIWGTTWLAIKYAVLGFPPLAGATLRFAIALILLYLWALFRKSNLRLSRQHYKPIMISAVLLYLFDYGLIYWGEQYLNSGVTAVFFATFPLFTSLVATFVLRSESFRLNIFIGVLIGFVGTVVVFYDQLLQTSFSELTALASAGILIAALSTAFSVVIVKKYLADVPPVSLTLHQMLWGVLILAVFSSGSGELSRLGFSWPAFWATVYLGIFGSAIAFVLYYRLLKTMTATSLSFIIYVTPLVAMFSGWLFLSEPITVNIIIGTAIIFVGIAVSQIKNAGNIRRRLFLFLRG